MRVRPLALRSVGWFARVGVGLAPPLILLYMSGQALLVRVDALLEQAAPLASAEASRVLGRPVRLGKITVDNRALSRTGLLTLLRNPDAYGSLPVIVEDLSLGNKPDEVRFAGGSPLAHVGRVTAFVSLPTLLSGKFNDSVSRILVEDADATVVRFVNGKLNLNQIVPKPKPGAKPNPPFHTVVEVERARVQFRDFASKFPALVQTGQPAVNRFVLPTSRVDLSGTRLIRFTTTARPQRGTPTARYLAGELFVSGSARRTQPSGELYIAPDGPSDNAPLFLVRVQATGVDLPYWYYYFVAPEQGFAVQSGRADVGVTLAAPRPPVTNVAANPKALLETLSVSIAARVNDAALALPALRQPLTSITGTIGYVDGAVQFEAGARLLGEPIASSGSLWGLPSLADAAKPKGSIKLPRPEIAARFDLGRIPLARVSRELLPANVTLPPGLSLGGVASARGSLFGKLSGRPEDLSFTADVAGISAAYAGYPGIQNLTARVGFSGTTVRVTNLSTTLEGGGVVRAQAITELSADLKRPVNARFSGQVEQLNLGSLSRLRLPNQARSVLPTDDARLRLSGQGSIAVSGELRRGSLSGAANVTTRSLLLGDIPFPVAQARILVRNNQVTVPSLRIESPVGRANVEGDVLPLPSVGAGGGSPPRLGLRFAFSALDLARLGRALRIPGLGGMVSGAGKVGGTIGDPSVSLDSFVALNLRLVTTPPKTGKTPPKPLRLALDSLVADGLQVSRRQVRITRPVTLRRFPASVAITGNVTDLLPRTPGAKANPRFALSATVRDLDYSEVQRQTGLAADAASRAVNASLAALQKAPAATPATTVNPPASVGGASETVPVAGSITQAVVRVRGTLADPRVTGFASAGNILVGRYPLEGASLNFDYNKQRAVVSGLRVKASVGQVTGQATVRADGGLSGSFAALGLDIERLSFLTDTRIRIGGLVDVRGQIGGTVRRPTVTASLAAPRIRVGETLYENVTAQNVRFTGGGSGSQGIVELPDFSLQSTDAALRVTGSRFDLGSREFTTVISLTNGDIGRVLDTIRRSGISETADGARIVQALGRLPQPLTGRFDIPRLAVRGRITGAGKLDPQVSGALTVRDLQVGTFKTDRVTIDGALNGQVVTVRSFQAEQPGAVIRGNGTYDPNGQVNALLETNEASLDLVRTLPGLASFPVYGTLEDFSVRVTGPASKPRVRASIQGRDLLVVVPSTTTPTRQVLETTQAQLKAAALKPDAKVKPVIVAGSAAAKPLEGFLLSLVRLEGEIAPDANGNDRILIPDAYIRAGNAEIRAEVLIPVALDLAASEPLRIASDRDLRVRITVPPIDLASFLETLRPTTQPGAVALTDSALPPANAQTVAQTARPAKRGKAGKDADKAVKAALPDVGGTAEALIALDGRLDKPQLSGFLRVTDARFRPPRPEGERDRISGINDFDANLLLETTETEGSRIVFDQFLLTLGGINGERGDKGTLQVGGSIRIDTLEDLQRLVDKGAVAETSGVNLRGAYNLLATLKGFRPAVDNLLELQEAGQGQADGKLAITGPLLTPRLASIDGPVRLTKTTIRPPKAEAAVPGERKEGVFNPSFDIALTIPDKASLVSPGTFAFDVQGDASITGKLFSDPSEATQVQQRNDTGTDVGIRAELQTIGGFVAFPTAYLKVQRGGTVQFRYGTVNPGITARDIVAKGTIKVAPGARLAGANRDQFSGQVLSQNATATQAYTSYKITATVNGSLDILNGSGPVRDRTNGLVQQKNPIALSSEPYLAEPQIYGLLLTQQQADLFSQGRFGDAFNQFATQALTSSYLPRFLSPFTSGIASTLGLEDFSLDYDYNPDAPVRVRILKRLPDPFNRFLIDATRSFQTRNVPGQQQPYQFSFSYELYQFNLRSDILPRLQLGFSTDEQRTNTFFLRGSVAY